MAPVLSGISEVCKKNGHPVLIGIKPVHEVQEMLMSMFFFDDADELLDYQIFRQKDQPLELEYEKLRVALRDAEVALQAHPENESIAAKVLELKNKLAALEQQAPWLTLDYPIEYLLWGPPHG
jgi:hypothetical protein